MAAASPELAGGAGFTFEDAVAAVYAAALLCETTAPGLPGRQVRHVAVQQGPLGHPLDDLIVQGEGPDGLRTRLSLQVKRKLIISSAASNHDFRGIVLRAHDTLTGPDFKVSLDRVGTVTGQIADSSMRTFVTLCEWARSDSDTAAFVRRLRTEGVAGEKEHQFDDVREILSSRVAEATLDAAAHQLLSHFVLVRFDLLHEGSVSEAEAVTKLADCLHPDDRSRADDLWRRLLALVRVAEGQAAAFDRKSLVARLGGAFRLCGAPSMRLPLARIAEEARLAAFEIVNDIDGVCIPRERFAADVREAVTQHRFVQIGGLPGTGKSVVLRSIVEEALAVGPVLFLKADRLSGRTWNQYAGANGFGAVQLEELLVELSTAGASTVFVDGLDRVEVAQRGIIQDVINTALRSTLLPKWRLVATVRDTGVEPLRTWLPTKLLADGAATIDVTELNDTEAAVLAAKKPALAGLLFGIEQVRAVVRRPFFACVLGKHRAHDTACPDSEIALAAAWWAGGGYGAEAANAVRRGNALVALAQAGAGTLGRRVPALGVDPEALAELVADGIVAWLTGGQLVRFVHDIYFEWAFLQLLISKGERWLDVVQQVGEPPVLGRVVELLSQVKLTQGPDWPTHLQRLETVTDVRPQWQRAWILGPLGLPSFSTHEAAFTEAMHGDGAKRITKLAVWFQAEKTRPNPLVLHDRMFPSLEPSERLALADTFAWPSDVGTWVRCCSWLVQEINRIPFTMRPDVFAVFEVWQNLYADSANPVSEQILRLATSWLAELDGWWHGRMFSAERAGWEQLRTGEVDELESRARATLLRAGRAYPSGVRVYLDSLRAVEHLPRPTFEQVLAFTPVLSEVCPTELVDFALRVMTRVLPERRAHDSTASTFGSQVRDYDWHTLSINDQYLFLPSAPTREPFASLFARAPTEARRLVRGLANHAITAWRQLHVLDHQPRGTPLPLTLRFPWGTQTFWGTGSEYLWSRGVGGPHAVASGLMALEAWAFAELEKGRPADDVIREVLDGHEGAGALAVAVSITLEANRSSDVTLPLLTSQRLWGWDIQRNVSDLFGGNNLNGFQEQDKRHYEAVLQENKRQSRRLDIRALARGCVFSRSDIGIKVAAAVTAFVDDLPFDFDEQQQDAGTVSKLKRTAEIWAEVGNPENYQAKAMEDGSGMLIQLNNPKAVGPDIEEIHRGNTEMVEHLTLLNWTHDSFEKGALGEQLDLEKAIEKARLLDVPTLFDRAHPHGSPSHQRQAAVAGVAAVVLRFGKDLSSADLAWASDVCSRAALTAETPDSRLFAGPLLFHHPRLYAARGLAVLLRCDSTGAAAREALIRLTANPFEQVVVEALGALLGVWDARPEIAWHGLELAIRLSCLEQPPLGAAQVEREEEHARQIETVVERALTRSKDARGARPSPLPKMPPAWVQAEADRLGKRRPRGEESRLEWRHPSTTFRWGFLAKVMERLPVLHAMADQVRREFFLSWCDDLVGWTIEWLCPSWTRRQEAGDFEARAVELYEWRRNLYRFLARVSLHQDASESLRRFVKPAEATDDEVFASLMESYVAFLACNVMDEAVVPRTPLALLESILPRLLSHESWRRASWDERAPRSAELSRMIKSVFFVEVEKAMGAVRFANGDWREVSVIFPLIEPVLKAYGDNWIVTSAFLTMCERAFESYPIDRFVAQLPMVLGRSEGTPLGWRGTSLPARLAALIQRFSERTQPLPPATARALIHALDALVDMGNRRAAAVQTSEVFKDVRTLDCA